MSSKQRFQEILEEVRSDLTYLENDLYNALRDKLIESNYYVDKDLRKWLFDAFLDKMYEINSK